MTALLGQDFCNFMLAWVDDDKVQFASGIFGPARRDRGNFLFPGEMGDLGYALTKFALRGARERSRVSFPGKVLETNGEQVAPNVVVWDSAIDEMDYAALREGHTAVFDGNPTTFEILVDYPMAAAPPREQAPPPLVPEGETRDGFKVALRSLELTRSIDFTDGETDGELEIGLQVAGPEGAEPASAEDVQIKRAVTDTGEELHLAQWRQIYMQTTEWTRDGMVQEAQPCIRLSAPAAGSTALVKLEGQFTLTCSSGAKEVRVAPLSAWVGRRLEHPDLGDVVVHLDAVSPGRVTIRCNDEDAIKKVRFESEFDERIECNSWGTSYAPGGMREMTYRLEVPAGGAMILEVHQDRSKYTVPFSFTNITLP